VAGALADYGVLIAGPPGDPVVDVDASNTLRATTRAERGEEPFFDRGPGYPLLSGGRPAADVDYL
jgi:N-methylhydantoinase B